MFSHSLTGIIIITLNLYLVLLINVVSLTFRVSRTYVSIFSGLATYG